MSNTATFTYHKKQQLVSSTVLTVPIPSYFVSDKGKDFVKIISQTELTRVNIVDLKIVYDDFFGFCPEGYSPTTEQEFTAAYELCEASLRDKTFSHEHDIPV